MKNEWVPFQLFQPPVNLMIEIKYPGGNIFRGKVTEYCSKTKCMWRPSYELKAVLSSLYAPELRLLEHIESWRPYE